MSAQKYFSIASYKTASRCWVPATNNTTRYFSSRNRCINFNNINDGHLVSNDDVFTSSIQDATISSSTASSTSSSNDELFEPTVFSSEEIHTPHPVNKA